MKPAEFWCNAGIFPLYVKRLASESLAMTRRDFMLGLLALPVAATAGDDKQRCEWLRERVRQMDARLRAGYAPAQGRRLRAKRRELAMEKFRACR